VKTVSKSNESVRAFQKNITSKMRSTLESVQGLSEITSEITETNQQVKLISVHLGLLATQADGDLEKNMKNSSETMHKHTDNLKQNIAHFLRLIEKVTNEAQETREAVNESINATENMLNLNKDSHEALNKIDQESTKLLNHASSVQSSVAQMKSNSSEVIGTVKNVKQHIIDGAAHSQDTASAISDVTEKSNKLSKTVKHFKTTK
jgi:methyl-accepting chemotaxis protein